MRSQNSTMHQNAAYGYKAFKSRMTVSFFLLHILYKLIYHSTPSLPKRVGLEKQLYRNAYHLYSKNIRIKICFDGCLLPFYSVIGENFETNETSDSLLHWLY